uniref:Uncharacterized protein n=1 Tax=Chromera velia CCMP2878 TaxID=1169474 RepID=A0A0G4GNE2_9ALVE|eukprot:Cvel_22669.t1-p1 / transcript=Cvel_22669.t1 / gene=Cvel_22669 / organism=Chromera_velia_CCMP2878 / gene_product=hypothetical protein / transcript_product=hypothetical protein / location=Cvel_scaffold2253:2080-13920(+) / protein_length=1065 / sequence_SO=supercontig / SO=protein_coding / is_pseudo=false
MIVVEYQNKRTLQTRKIAVPTPAEKDSRTLDEWRANVENAITATTKETVCVERFTSTLAGEEVMLPLNAPAHVALKGVQIIKAVCGVQMKPQESPAAAVAAVGGSAATPESTARAPLSEDQEIDDFGREIARLATLPGSLLDRNVLANQWESLRADEKRERKFKTILGHLDYKRIMKAYKGATEEKWYHMITPEVINTVILRDEWRIRHAFMYGTASTRAQDSSLIPLFSDTDGSLRSGLFSPRELTDEERQHPIVPPLEGISAVPDLISPATPHLESFRFCFDQFSYCQLKGVFEAINQTPGSPARVYAAGGSVLQAAARWTPETAMEWEDFGQGTPLSELYQWGDEIASALRHVPLSPNVKWKLSEMIVQDQARMKRLTNTAEHFNWGHGWPFHQSDVDLFVCADSLEHGTSLEEILAFFDLDCISVGYDGKNVYGLPRFIRALNTRHNFVEPARLRRWSTGSRIVKFRKRGFGCVFSEICKHEPRCDLSTTLDEEMARKIAAINVIDRQYDSLGYSMVSLPRARKIGHGVALDEHIRKNQEENKKAVQLFSQGEMNLKPPPLSAQYEFCFGNQSTSDLNIIRLVAGISLPTIHKGIPTAGQDQNTDNATICAALGVSPLPGVRCESLNTSKRNASVDLSGRVAVVTGGRVRVGHATARRLLRLGACVVVTSRFPRCCLRKFWREYPEETRKWIEEGRLEVWGLDFRHLPSVTHFASALAKKHSVVHFLINNAAQTVRRPPSHYRELVTEETAGDLEAELRKAIGHTWGPSLPPVQEKSERKEETGSNGKLAKMSSFELASLSEVVEGGTPALLTQLAVCNGDEVEERSPEVDADLEPVDLRQGTSWSGGILQVGAMELAEVQLVNVMAPFQLLQALTPCLRAGAKEAGSPAIVVNVTSAEGKFGFGGAEDGRVGGSPGGNGGSVSLGETARGSKTSRHPHTSMAKAALNMMTCAAAQELSRSSIAIYSVDVGWISSMAPQQELKANPRTWSTPALTEDDGAARVLDPLLLSVVLNKMETGGESDLGSRKDKAEREVLGRAGGGDKIPFPTGVLLRNFVVSDW